MKTNLYIKDLLEIEITLRNLMQSIGQNDKCVEYEFALYIFRDIFISVLDEVASKRELRFKNNTEQHQTFFYCKFAANI